MTHSPYRYLAIVLAWLVAWATPALSDTYPSQPIRIVVPTPAGGIADLLSRTLANKMGESGKTMVVENRTGGSGVIAADTVAKAAPDGYTLYMGLHQTQAILPHLMAKLPYDPVKDFAPIILIGPRPTFWSCIRRCRRSRRRNSSPMPRPIPARSPMRRPATAAPGISWVSSSG